MGRVFGRSAVSAGAMVLAFGGMSLTSPAAAALDCDRGTRNGLVTGLVGGLCDVVSGLTETTRELTETAQGLTETAGELTEAVRDVTGVLPRAGEDGGVGDVLRDKVGRVTDGLSGKTGPAERPQARPEKTVPAPPSGCPRPGAPGCAARWEAPSRRTAEPPARRHARDAKTEDAKRDERAREETERRRAAPLPIEPPRPPVRRPHELNRSEPEPRQPEPRQPDPVDLDVPRADLLWPYAEGPRTPMRVPPVPIKPERPSDATGTALTAILLISAILAARIGYARRRRDDRIPFEPLSGRSGRHRLA